MTGFYHETLMFNLYFKTKAFFPLFKSTEQSNLEKWTKRHLFNTSLFHNSRYRETSRLIFLDFFCILIPRMEWAMAWQSLFPPHWLWRKSRVTLSLSNTSRCFLGWVTLHVHNYHLWQKFRQISMWWERELCYDNVILTQNSLSLF